jgi:hypothetical protein
MTPFDLVYPTSLEDGSSDADLAGSVAETVSRPRVEPADSFVLHAPLELAARVALLPHVSAEGRNQARQQLRVLAREYDASGEAVGSPRPLEPESVAAAAGTLARAIDAGDLDAVDAGAAWLGTHASGAELRAHLTDAVLVRLAAAGHAPIFLYQLPRVAPRGELTSALLRPLARELARRPEWRLGWFDRADPAPPRPRPARAPGRVLWDAVAATPRLGVPGSDFIYPLMAQAEGSGVAADLLAGPVAAVDPIAGARVLLRAAALSMLQEPPDHAPYGWSHCLTMPQAVLGIAGAARDPRVSLAVAATFVVGFRAALALNPLTPAYDPADPGLELHTALGSAPAVAAAAAWHVPPADRPRLVTALATRASGHRDAHLVKYTLACLDAAAWDRDQAGLYLAAAASLGGYWATA